MGVLRKNAALHTEVYDKLKSIYGLLLDYDEEKALKYVDWTLKKLVKNTNHDKENSIRNEIKKLNPTSENYNNENGELRSKLKSVLHRNYPRDLKTGDIVHVHFGVGVGEELSDNHYGIIICRIGAMFLVAPLTSDEKMFGKENLTVRIKTNGNPDQIGYVCYDDMRFVHKRRIEIAGCNLKNVGTEFVDKIMENYNIIVKKHQET